MAHGAPDHVQMMDVNVLTYVDKASVKMTEVITPGSSYSPINVTGIGCFGSLSYKVDNKYTTTWIFVDGVVWLRLQIETLWEILKLGGNSPYSPYGVTRYDEVNDNYATWINFGWQLSFVKSLEVKIVSSWENDITCRYIMAHWKEKV